jgi:microcystin-dependent protein
VALETPTYISDLVVTNPAHSDGLNQADGHLRAIKATLRNTFPNFNGPVNLTDEQLNALLSGFSAADGSAAAPTFNFISEPGLGLYRKAAATLSFTGRLVGQGAAVIGGLVDFAGPDATIPAGYLACDGQAVSRTTYAELFAAIGTTWGAGDGTTTFNLPNLLDRYRRHRNVGGTRAGAVGTLQADVFKLHAHDFSGNTGTESADHTHSFSGTTGTDSPDHSHAYSAPQVNSTTGGGSFGTVGGGTGASTGGASARHAHSFSGTTSGRSAAHTHAYSGTTTSVGDATETRPLSATVLTLIRAL